mmetsp:Transcript_5660/g.13110  ORF Transcript_5660/g.13110 Transcript_5660/m.13110 type:complete len:99 (+) Transcript_5660:361-657(+)
MVARTEVASSAVEPREAWAVLATAAEEAAGEAAVELEGERQVAGAKQVEGAAAAMERDEGAMVVAVMGWGRQAPVAAATVAQARMALEAKAAEAAGET